MQPDRQLGRLHDGARSLAQGGRGIATARAFIPSCLQGFIVVPGSLVAVVPLDRPMRTMASALGLGRPQAVIDPASGIRALFRFRI